MDDSITGNLRAWGQAQVSVPPEANAEYSRGSEPFERVLVRDESAHSAPHPEPHEGRSAATAAVALAAVLGALLIIVAQFTALYHVHVPTSATPVKSVGTGGNHAWAPIPLALLAAVLAFAAYRYRNRVALLAIALLGVVTLAIALLGDLPDVHATGLIGSGASQYVEGTASPSAGLYMETLGAIVLLVSGGVGFLLLAPSRRQSD
ncbi:MAG TPA: hypothetical protein VMG37_17755 [Solirubrobacteraceae bacterium]|nr:hypothetical protein [Solirubrobacteraceae bacterium]